VPWTGGAAIGVRAPSMTSVHQWLRGLGSGQCTTGEISGTWESVARVRAWFIPAVRRAEPVCACDVMVAFGLVL
jgi:hypothetical protein